MDKMKKALQAIVLMCMCCFPLLMITGCGLSDRILCAYCGDEGNRVVVYADGITEDGIKYTSCVGLAGLIGCGLDTWCFPTECLYVKPDNDNITSGTICYYNEFGCLSEETVKSHASYTSSGCSCLGLVCFGENYIVDVAEGDVRVDGYNTCMGINCPNSRLDLTDFDRSILGATNNSWDRQFLKGCWTCTVPDKNNEESEARE